MRALGTAAVGVMWMSMLALSTGCASTSSTAHSARLRDARVAPVKPDLLKMPTVKADAEVARLSKVHEELLLRLRQTEDQLLVVVAKSAAYDEQAGRDLLKLQEQRLVLSVALLEVQCQRRQRAQDVADGVAQDVAQPEDTTSQTLETPSPVGKHGRRAWADKLAPLLKRARVTIAQNKRLRERFNSRFWSSAQGFPRETGSQAAPAAPIAKFTNRVARDFAGAKDEVHDPEGISADDDRRLRVEETRRPKHDLPTSAKPRSGVEAAAVVTEGAAPDIGPALQGFLPQMQACIPAEVRQQGVAFTVRARLGAAGQVRGARLSGGHPLSPSVAACVVDVMSRVRVPGGGGRIISVPLRISGR